MRNMEYHRCIAYTKNNKKCRCKIPNNQFFCCEDHYPFNKELFSEGCFMCNEKIKHADELYYFHCKHAFHKECYDEWSKFSNYQENICMLCRNEVLKKPLKKIKIRPHGVFNKNEYKKLEDILKVISI